MGLGWRSDMETLSKLTSPCEGNPLAIDRFPHKLTVMQSIDVLFVIKTAEQTAQLFTISDAMTLM